MNLVSDLDLAPSDYSAPDFLADRYHQQLAEAGQQGWLAKSPLAHFVLDRDSGEFSWSGPARPSPDYGPGAKVTLLAGTRPWRVGLEG